MSSNKRLQHRSGLPPQIWRWPLRLLHAELRGCNPAGRSEAGKTSPMVNGSAHESSVGNSGCELCPVLARPCDQTRSECGPTTDNDGVLDSQLPCICCGRTQHVQEAGPAQKCRFYSKRKCDR